LLSYPHNFPINALKIDRTFINKLSANGGNQEIITSIISLANSLHFDVIAEGVGMTHQLSTIEGLHCAGPNPSRRKPVPCLTLSAKKPCNCSKNKL
jgi:EAL domain-containing protein (putative c-di-GMP-specific phosphodiesterase class I)